MKSLTMIAGILVLGLLTSCEMECPDCPSCEEPGECELTEWGMHVREELISLFLDVEAMAIPPVNLKVNHEKLILQKESDPT
jgi:hypothetical protein